MPKHELIPQLVLSLAGPSGPLSWPPVSESENMKEADRIQQGVALFSQQSPRIILLFHLITPRKIFLQSQRGRSRTLMSDSLLEYSD